MVLPCKLTHFCCKFPLKDGIAIIGIIEMVLAGLIVMLSSHLLTFTYISEEQFIRSSCAIQRLTMAITAPSNDLLTTRVILFTLIFINGFVFVITYIFLCSALRKSARLFFFWMIAECLLILAVLIFGIYSIFLLVSKAEYKIMTFHVVYMVITTPVRFYFVLVVHSYYQEISELQQTM